MTVRGKRVLVTGAGGFIGSHLTERLVREGAEVRVLLHYNALGSLGWLDSSEVTKDIETIRGDIADRDSVDAAVKGSDIVFHLAALIGIPYSYTAPGHYVRTNIDGTLNVLQSARSSGVERVLHTSTSEVYGSAQYVPIDEAHPLVGQSPYAATKIGADQLALSFFRSFELPVVVVRPFNTYGPRQSVRAVIPTIITQLMAGRQVRLGTLETSRDLNFVLDTVDGFVRAATADSVLGETINIGSGHSVSIEQLVMIISRLMERDPEIVLENTRLRPERSEVTRLLADNAKAQSLLGWHPKYSLEEGLAETIQWFSLGRHAADPAVYGV